MAGDLLTQATVYLGAAVLTVPIAARLGLGSVLGYLIAGMAIGPAVLGLVGQETEDVMHASEFGVVMMLFLVGLELDPERLWRMRGTVFGFGAAQLLGTALLITPIGLFVFRLPWQQAVAVGMIVGMSSTAIALQTLTEKGLLRSASGEVAFSILLFQDVAVIPLLALFPLLATLPVDGGAHGGSLIADLPAWQRALAVAAAVIAVVAAGRFVVGPVLRLVARSGLREMFTAASLLIVVGVAWLMGAVGLSAALGAFVAGVVLASSEFRHELMADVEPFKGLLLGVFFMAVGATINFQLVVSIPGIVVALTLALLLVKASVLLFVGRMAGLCGEAKVLLAVALSQVGEFAFVLFSFASKNGILPELVTAPLVAATAFSMAATPFLFVLHERVLAPWLTGFKKAEVERPSDVVDEHNPVIVAGYGRFGQITGRLLRAHGIGVTVLDVDSEQVEMLAKYGHKVFYGDASRHDLLHAAGASTARVLVVAVNGPEKVQEIVQLAQRHFPHLAILARAEGRPEAYALVRGGADGVYRETFDTAVRVGTDALRLLGLPAHAAHRAGRLFREHDEAAVRELAHHHEESEAFISVAQERMRRFEEVLRQDRAQLPQIEDEGWEIDGR